MRMAVGYKIRYVNSNFLVPKIYTEFCTKETFTDVTLVSDDLRPISAHRLVLGAASPVLHKLLTVQQITHPVLYLSGTRHELLILLLQLIYNGEVDVKAEMIESFMKISAELEIKELSQNIVQENLLDETNGKSEGTGSSETIGDLIEDLSGFIKELSQNNVEEDSLDKTNGKCEETESIGDLIDDLSEEELLKIKDICVKNSVKQEAVSNCIVNETLEDSNDNLVSNELHNEMLDLKQEYPEFEMKPNIVKRERGTCHVCGIIMKSSKSMKRHILTKHGGLKFACNICSFKATQSGTLKTHIKAKHENVSFRCSRCEFSDHCHGNIIEHVRRSHIEKGKQEDFSTKYTEYLCNKCHKQFCNRSEVSEHQENEHDMKQSCNQCTFKTTRKAILREHTLSQHDGFLYKCQQCDYESTQKKLLMKHIMIVHPDSSHLYKCDKCDYKSPEANLLKKHKELYHSHETNLENKVNLEKPQMTECQQCGKKYFDKSGLLRHIKSKHKGIKHLCHFCPYKSSHPYDVKIHIRSVHEGGKYYCKLCSAEFKFKSGLSSHTKSVHDGIRYPCNYCDFKAKHANGLRYHEKAQHFDEVEKTKMEI